MFWSLKPFISFNNNWTRFVFQGCIIWNFNGFYFYGALLSSINFCLFVEEFDSNVSGKAIRLLITILIGWNGNLFLCCLCIWLRYKDYQLINIGYYWFLISAHLGCHSVIQWGRWKHNETTSAPSGWEKCH